MKIVSIVPAWNRRDDTLACLLSLSRQEAGCHRHELLLVDNGSDDGTAEAARQALPGLGVVSLEANRGFAAAANIGIETALEQGADFTWLVNNDTLALPGLLGMLLDAMAVEGIGMATPTVCTMDEPDVVWPSAGWRRSLTLAAFDTTARPPSDEPYDVEWATGCCLLVRAEVWRRIGLFDPAYVFYYEDHDLCLRARAAGWRIVHVPRARVLHRVAGSTGRGSALQMYLLARASVPFYWRHSRGLRRVFMVAYRLGSLARTLSECALDRRWGAAAAYVRGLRDGAAELRTSRRNGLVGPSGPIKV